MTKKILGIDLGTTYSCTALVDEHGKPSVLPNSDSELTTPSVVWFEDENHIQVGKVAKQCARIYPDRVIAFVKRDMGHEAVYDIDGHKYKPEMVSSLILRKLVADASAAIGEEIKEVVITCPAYFGVNEREATRNAGVLAGLEVRHILNEPTAAAVCYGLDRGSEDEVVLVYDLGGGTFDITMIEIAGGSIRVLYTTGDHNLGGKDWDERLVNFLAEEFVKANADSGDPREDRMSLQTLVTEAEEIKKGLTTREKYPYNVMHNGARAKVEITRSGFESLTADLLSRTIDYTKTAIEGGLRQLRNLYAGLGRPKEAKLSRVLLVGGSSRMPAVARELHQLTGMNPEMFDPDLAVAKGAALVGLKLAAGDMIREIIATNTGEDAKTIDLDKVDPKTREEAARKAAAKGGAQFRLGGKALEELATGKLVNVASKGFGVVVVGDNGDEVVHLIHSNTPLPAEFTGRQFGTLRDNQEIVHVRVMEQGGQDESPDVGANVELVQGDIVGLPAQLPAGTPIHITFQLEEDGTLSTYAVEPSSGRDLKLKAKVREGVMSSEEVQTAKGVLLQKAVS
jgi:molecular chaperone DnaK